MHHPDLVVDGQRNCQYVCRATMTPDSFFKYISLDQHSATPKYLQLANAIIQAIKNGHIKKDQVVPSINELSFELEISRDTAERGYKYLREMGLLASVPGKGYYIKNTDVKEQLRIFLLFNKLSAHKKIIYDSLAANLAGKALIDFYIYDNDFTFFKRILESKKNEYSHYVIIPHFLEGGENAHHVINTIDKSKLILLDKILPGVTGEFAAVYENFEKDIYSAMERALPKLTKYNAINLIFPQHTYFPQEIVKGFISFCDKFAFSHEVVHDIGKAQIEKGAVYINLMEDDLVLLIEKILADKLVVGKDVGVISYNETPLKRIILDGITTISTDFQLMGKKTAELILTNSRERVEIPFTLTMRSSL